MCAGADPKDWETAEEVSSCVYDEVFDFYSRERAKSMGVPVDNGSIPTVLSNVRVTTDVGDPAA
eukprot:3340840-Lingulodinium_polyedra.AAC.1